MVMSAVEGKPCVVLAIENRDKPVALALLETADGLIKRVDICMSCRILLRQSALVNIRRDGCPTTRSTRTGLARSAAAERRR